MRAFWTVVTALSLIGCGGNNPPTPDLGSPVDDLSIPASGDMAGTCTAATTGFWVISSTGLLSLVSPDPNAWEGTTATVVDENNQSVGLGFMTVIGDTIYIHSNAAFYVGTLSSIQNGKLSVIKQPAPTGFPIGAYVGQIAPNGNKGDLIVLYSTGAGGYLGEIAIGSGAGVLTPSNTQLSARCNFSDFEGSVAGDGYQVKAICGNEVDMVSDTQLPTTVATGMQGQLAGMQSYKGKVYLMDRVGNVYDENLKLIKKTRRCTASTTNPGYGTPVPVLGL